MPIFSRVSEGSLLSEERLVHARDGYMPSRVTPTSEMAFAQWTERASVQSDIVVAREMAGLANDQLDVLFSEFVQSPRLRRTDMLRWGWPVGGGAAALGGLLLLVQEATREGSAAQMDPLRWFAVSLLGIGMLALSAGSVSALHKAPLEMAYAKVGLFVGVLDEQHPWLYKTAQLLRHKSAVQYRDRVLRERGALRGVDYVLMREIVLAHDSLELTRTARTVRHFVQDTTQSHVPQREEPLPLVESAALTASTDLPSKVQPD